MSGCFACTFVSVPRVCMVPEEAGREVRFPATGVTDARESQDPGSPLNGPESRGGAARVLTTEPSFQLHSFPLDSVGFGLELIH